MNPEEQVISGDTLRKKMGIVMGKEKAKSARALFAIVE
jgi:hypothetical protein